MIILQVAPSGIDVNEVYNSMLAVDNIGSIHGLHIWSVSSSEVFLSCHICVQGGADVIATDDIIRNANSLLEEKYGIKHTTLQIEKSSLCNFDKGNCCR